MTKVVVLGGGFGGVKVALGLSKVAQVILVNDSPFHCYTPDLYEVVTTKLKHEDKLSFENLVSSVNIPLKSIFSRVELIEQEVKSIDLKSKQISFAEGHLSFDYLVLALGSETNYFGIEGAKDFSHPLKKTEDALNIHNDLEELMMKGSVKVVVAGGGFTGVELAGNLVSFIKGQVSVIEGSDMVLGGMPPWAQTKALKRLKDLGVRVMLKSLIQEVRENQILIKNGEKIEFDYLIWTAGVKPQALEIKGVTLTDKGQVSVLADLSVEGWPEVSAIGDLAFFKEGDRVAPPAAWVAEGQAEVVIKNIKALLSGQATKTFNLPQSAFVVPVGKHYALSNAFGLRFSGLVAWIMKMGVTLIYMTSILPLHKALAYWFKGVRLRIDE